MSSVGTTFIKHIYAQDGLENPPATMQESDTANFVSSSGGPVNQSCHPGRFVFYPDYALSDLPLEHVCGRNMSNRTPLCRPHQRKT